MDFFQSAKFDIQVSDLMDQLHVPGLCIALVHNNITASKAFGVISVASAEPCTADSLFDIASSSKILTAISVALLVEDGQQHPSITFDTPVSQILPDDFVLSDAEYTKHVTIDDILGHRTGLPRSVRPICLVPVSPLSHSTPHIEGLTSKCSHDSSYFGVNSERPDDARSVTRNLRNLQLCAPIRSRFIYSNIMYTVATHLVETVTRTPFSDFLDSRIFAPLRMSSSSLQPSRSHARGFGARLASGHMWDASASRHREFPALECPEGQGAGSIITSAADYLLLVKALLQQQAPVSKAVYASLTKMRSLPNPDSANVQPLSSPRFYSAGLMIEYYRGHAIIGHNGGVPGFGSRFFFVPSLRLGAVLLGNALEAAAVAVHLQQALIDSILGPVSSQAGSNETEPIIQRPSEAKPKTEEAEQQEMPLTSYTGHYWNPGYRGLHVEIRDAQLFIDARDRSFPSTLTLRHVSGQTKYLAYAQAGESVGGLPRDDEPLRAEFVFDNDRAVKLGLILDPDLSLVWFDRVHAEATPYVFV
ncbi:beta-lactamase family protein [Beauveria brongniartii RCEF 3172]|uniref:Beta-lactamase family protein n=1 Tax=Beauveria brongniartii RCEF 3172 TaxID=1081107 RepID=A0A167G0H5_9HYPO|nr:beta-lactamase family protein [Beauveria brongniartii RCEF 3172]